VCAHTYIHTYIYIYICIYVYICIYIYIYICIHTHTYMCSIYIYVCVCVHTHEYFFFAELVQAIMDTCADSFEKRRNDAAKHPLSSVLPPDQDAVVQDYLIFPTQARFTHAPDRSSALLSNITETASEKEFASDIRLHAQGIVSCTCGMPKITGLPCEHNTFHAMKCHLSIDKIVNHKLTTVGWKESYQAADAVGGFGTVRKTIYACTHAYVVTYIAYIYTTHACVRVREQVNVHNNIHTYMQARIHACTTYLHTAYMHTTHPYMRACVRK
jgi:hypothetical protein